MLDRERAKDLYFEVYLLSLKPEATEVSKKLRKCILLTNATMEKN